MKEQTKTKKSTVLIISAIAALSIALIFYYSLKNPAADAQITELVANYNKNCPLVIQEGIRLDSVSLPDSKDVQYNLTLLNVEKKTAEIDTIKQNIEQSLLSTVKANPGLKTFRDNDFTLNYNYNDKNKVNLFQIVIVPDQYK